MKPPNSLSNEKLIAYSEIVAREIDMLRWSASMLYRFQMAEPTGLLSKSHIAQVTDDVYLEAFAMHSRNLIDFLYLRNSKGGERPTDVVIQDYIDPAVLGPVQPAISPLLENTKVKADKLLAHLTLTRLDEGMFMKGWLYTEIFQQIMSAFNQIAPFVSETNTSEHFRAAIKPLHLPLIPITISEVKDPVRQLAGISMSVQLPNG
jgi:hypothetical protein